MVGRYDRSDVCRFCVNHDEEKQKCVCEDHLNCRDCMMPRAVMLRDVVIKE